MLLMPCKRVGNRNNHLKKQKKQWLNNFIFFLTFETWRRVTKFDINMLTIQTNMFCQIEGQNKDENKFDAWKNWWKLCKMLNITHYP